MRAKLTTILGYVLLGAVTIAMASSWHSSVNVADMVQLVVFAAGAMSLFLMTQGRSHK